MATPTCTNFKDCLTTNPIDGTKAATDFTSFSSMAIFAINLVAYLANAILIIFILYSLTKGIYRLITAEDSDTFTVVKETLTQAVLAIVGLLVLWGVLFILGEVLSLMGVSDADNIYFNIGTIFQP